MGLVAELALAYKLAYTASLTLRQLGELYGVNLGGRRARRLVALSKSLTYLTALHTLYMLEALYTRRVVAGWTARS